MKNVFLALFALAIALVVAPDVSRAAPYFPATPAPASSYPAVASPQYCYNEALATAPFCLLTIRPLEGDLVVASYVTLAPPVAFPGTGAQNVANNFLQFAQLVGGANAVYEYAPGTVQALAVPGTFLFPGDGQSAVYDYPGALIAASANTAGTTGSVNAISVSFTPKYTGGSLIAFFTGSGASNSAATVSFSASGQTWTTDGGGPDSSSFGQLLFSGHASATSPIAGAAETITATLSSAATVTGPLSNLVVVQIVPGTPPTQLIKYATPAPIGTFAFPTASPTPSPTPSGPTPTPAPSGTPFPTPPAPTPVPSQTGYNAAILANGPVIYWPLNDAAGTTWAGDLSGNGVEGLVGSSVLLGQNQVLTGTNNTSALFPGQDLQQGAIQAYDNPATPLFSNAFTLEALIGPNACSSTTGSKNDIFINGLDGSQYAVWFGLDSSCDLTVSMRTSANTGGLTLVDYTGALSTLNDYDVAVVWNGTTLTLWKNDVAVASASLSGVYKTTGDFSIGGPFGNNTDPAYNGNISNLALYNYALTSSQLAADYTAATATVTCTVCPAPTATPPTSVSGMVASVASFINNSATVTSNLAAGSVMPPYVINSVSIPGFSNIVTLSFNSNHVPTNITTGATITPPAPGHISYLANGVGKFVFQWQMTPGVQYHLNTPSFVDTVTSATVPAVSYPITAPTLPPIPTPAPFPTDKDPNWYGPGALMPGPYGYSAGNGNATVYTGNPTQQTIDENQIYAIASAYESSQVTPRGYVIIAPAPNQTWQDGFGGSAAWGLTDAGILESIHEGMKVMIALTEYNAPAAQSYGSSWLFDSPGTFSAMCAAVAEHAKVNYPAGDYEFEIFNEPNNPGYWTPRNGTAAQYNPAYIDETGAGAALYMKPCYAAIKKYLPSVKVLGPSLEQGVAGTASDARNFLQTMYNNGCHQGVCWDELTMHDYDFTDPAFHNAKDVDGTGAGQCQNFTSTATTYPCELRFRTYKDLQQVAFNNGDTLAGGYVHVLDTESDIGSCTSAYAQCFDKGVVAYYMAELFNYARADDTFDGPAWTRLYVDGSEDIYYGSRVWTSQYTPKQPMLSTFQAFMLAGPTPNPNFTNFPTKIPTYGNSYGYHLPLAQENPPLPGGISPKEPPCLPGFGCPTAVPSVTPSPSPTPVPTATPSPIAAPTATPTNGYVEPAGKFSDMFGVDVNWSSGTQNFGSPPPVPNPGNTDEPAVAYLKLSGVKHVRESCIFFCNYQAAEQTYYADLYAHEGIRMISGSVGMYLSELQQVQTLYGGSVEGIEFGNEWDDGKTVPIPLGAAASEGALQITVQYNYANTFIVPNSTYQFNDGSGEQFTVASVVGQSAFNIKLPLQHTHTASATFTRVGPFTNDTNNWLAYWSPQIRQYQPTFEIMGSSLAFPVNASQFAGIGNGYLVNSEEDHGYPNDGANPEGPTGDSSQGLSLNYTTPCSVNNTSYSWGYDTCQSQIQATGVLAPYNAALPPYFPVTTTEYAYEVVPVGNSFNASYAPYPIPDPIGAQYLARAYFNAQQARAHFYWFNLMSGQNAPNGPFCNYGLIDTYGSPTNSCAYGVSLPAGTHPKPEWYTWESLIHFFSDPACVYPTCTFTPYTYPVTLSAPSPTIEMKRFEWSTGKNALVVWQGVQSYDSLTTASCQATTSCYLNPAPVTETITIPNMTSATVMLAPDVTTSDATPAPATTTAPDGNTEGGVQLCNVSSASPAPSNQYGCIGSASTLTVTNAGTSSASVTLPITDAPKIIMPIISGEPSPVPTALATTNPLPAGTPGAYPSAGYTASPYP
jgi:hypothetical protein